jgi:O-acetyl-ADP-ribose deacetylase (regulator of RNase III)
MKNHSICSVKGDITKIGTDVVVNAANDRLAPGDGVCGAIFAAAGYAQLLKACEGLGGCPTGQAVATPSFDLKSRGTSHIIHAVGPRFSRQNATMCDRQLVSAYRESLRLAERLGARSIAIPAISTGIFRFPADRAAALVADLLTTEAFDLDEIVLMALEPEKVETYAAALADAQRRR